MLISSKWPTLVGVQEVSCYGLLRAASSNRHTPNLRHLVLIHSRIWLGMGLIEVTQKALAPGRQFHFPQKSKNHHGIPWAVWIQTWIHLAMTGWLMLMLWGDPSSLSVIEKLRWAPSLDARNGCLKMGVPWCTCSEQWLYMIIHDYTRCPYAQTNLDDWAGD